MVANYKLLSVLSAAAAASASPVAHSARASGIAWGPCGEDIVQGPIPGQCANFTVPLDYTDKESKQTTDLQLLRIPGSKGNAKGSVFFNFGGPGLECRNTLASFSRNLDAVLGGEHDLIAIDPRGVANTLTFSCYDTPAERERAWYRGGAGKASDVATGENWALAETVVHACNHNEAAKERGSLISTPFAARDIMQVVDALGEDGLLRYWGLSYGTALGSTLVQLFPDRMDRVVLDGVLNMDQYYNGFDSEMWSDADATFSEFARMCVENADKCPLAKSHKSAEDIEKATWKLLEDVRQQPLVSNGTMVDYSTLEAGIRFGLYSPGSWESFGALLEALISRDLDSEEGMTAIASATGVADFISGQDDSAWGIQCTDKTFQGLTREQLQPELDTLFRTSRIADMAAPLWPICAQWELKPVEKFAGIGHDLRTKTPVLFVGNSFDPATPLRSAHNTSTHFADSVVLEHQGRGHASTAELSVCTFKAIRDYINDGKLPEAGAKCPTDTPPFSGLSWEHILPDLGYKAGNATGNSTVAARGFRGMPIAKSH